MLGNDADITHYAWGDDPHEDQPGGEENEGGSDEGHGDDDGFEPAEAHEMFAAGRRSSPFPFPAIGSIARGTQRLLSVQCAAPWSRKPESRKPGRVPKQTFTSHAMQCKRSPERLALSALWRILSFSEPLGRMVPPSNGVLFFSL